MRSVDFPNSSEHELVAQFGSPLYVYRAQKLRDRYAMLRDSFAYRPLQLHYAIVGNKNAYLLRVLDQLGAHFHANTLGDAFCALSAGVTEQRRWGSDAQRT